MTKNEQDFIYDESAPKDRAGFQKKYAYTSRAGRPNFHKLSLEKKYI